MIDLFASNGSTWYNKRYFLDELIKNDIRSGKYVVGTNLFNQVLEIHPDYQVDMLNEIYKGGVLKDKVVYLDPPHLIGAKSGIMVEKYTSLENEKQIEILAKNCEIISDMFLIIKWYDKDLDIDSFLNYFRPYFVDTIRFGDRKKVGNSWLIIMIRKDKINSANKNIL